MEDLKGTIKNLTAKLVSVLNQRNRDVIARRFGLKTGQKETLESIGRSYDITRERVRQIEEASLRQMREHLAAGASARIKPIVALAENVLEQAGGVLPEKDFYQQFFGVNKTRPAQREGKVGTGRPAAEVERAFGTPSPESSDAKGAAGNKVGTGAANAALAFVLTLDGNLRRLAEDDDFNAFWSLSHQHAEGFKSNVETFVKALHKHGGPVAETAVADWSKQASLSAKAADNFNTYLAVSKQLGRGMFGQIGLTSWPEIRPRGVRDKSYLVLKKVGKPRHFREIAQLINETFGARGTSDTRRAAGGKVGTGAANIQTVHNELIKDPRFVLVGRGLYGLAEWGYKAGTVKDVLVDVLKNARQPLAREEVVAQVLSHRLVKENTILLNLQDGSVFKKTEKGYTLKEA